LRTFTPVRAWADEPRHENLPGRQLPLLPDLPFVLMTRIGSLQQIRAGVHFQDQIDDFPERHISRVRPGPAAPADVIADAVLRNSLERVVEDLHVTLEPFVV